MPKRTYHRKPVRTKPPSATPTRKVIIEFPRDLYDETSSAAAELATDRSKLIRRAVEEFLVSLRQRRLEQEMIAGYVANAKLDRRIAEEFAAVDAESL